MATPVKILCLGGTLRMGSLNKRFARLAAQGVTAAGGESTFLDLRDYPLPVYDGDIETQGGLPENARKLKAILMAHQGLIVSAGEYNSSITGALKNMIDWTSRREDNEPAKAAYAGKVGLLLSAAPGAFGGMRAMVHVRAILSHMGLLMLPGQMALIKANEAFADDGSLKDPAQQKQLSDLIAELVSTTTKLHGA